MKQKEVEYSSQGLLTLLPKLTIKFYVNEIYGIINDYKVGQKLGAFIIVFRNLEIAFLGLLGDRLDKLVEIDANLSFMSQDSNFFQFFSESSSVDGIVGFLFAVNLGILLTIIFMYFQYMFKMINKEQRSLQLDQSKDKKNIQYENNDMSLDLSASTLYSSQQNLRSSQHSSFRIIFSFIVLINYHLLLVPAIYFSTNNLSNVLYTISFILSAILGFIVCDSDFDYTIRNKNFLGKSFSHWSYLMLFLEIICLSVFQVNSEANFIMLICLFLIKLIYSSYTNPYYLKKAMELDLFSSFYLLSLSSIMVFCVDKKTLKGLEAFLFFFFIPFTWKLSKVACFYYHEKIKDKFQELSSKECMVKGYEMNQIIRQENLFTDLINTQQNSKRKINFLNLINNFTSISYEQFPSVSNQNQQQQQNSQAKRKSMVEQFNVTSEQQKEENVTFDQVKSIIQKYLEKIIFGQKTFSNEFIYSYLVFLLEVRQSKKLYWLNFLMWRSKSKINSSIKKLQIIQTIQSIFEEEKLVIQRTQGHINPFYEGFISVIVFEQRIEVAHKLLDKCIGLKLLILNMMRQKLIVLTELIKLIENQQILLFQLRKILTQLASVNEDSIDLIQIQIYYLQCLSFNEQDIKISQLNQYKKSYLNQIRNIFQKDSCVAFIFYDLSANQCYFTKVSQYFERIFSVKNEDVIGKKIESFIPSKIQVQHQSYVKNFLEEQQQQQTESESLLQLKEGEQKASLTSDQKRIQQKISNQNQSFQPICKMGRQMILCLNGNRNVIPISIDLRINSLSYEQFGFTANIRKIKNSFDYILYDSSNFEIIGLSKNINEYLFPDVQLRKINLATIFPFLQEVNAKKEDNSQNMGTDYFNSERSTFRVVKQSEPENENLNQNNSNSRRSGTVHYSLVHKKNLHLKIFDFITILQQPKYKKSSTYNSSYTCSTKDQSIAKINIEKDLIFIYMEVKVFETKYKDVQNLNYLQISKVKMINPFEQANYIISYIKENIALYQLSFPQQKIDRIISDLNKKHKLYENEQEQLAIFLSEQKKISEELQKEQLQPSYTKNLSLNFINSHPNLPNLESSVIQKDLNQSQVQKKVNEKEQVGTCNQIIEEEVSISNKSDQNDETNNNEHLNSFQNKNNLKQSLAEISHNYEFMSNYQFPLISPDSTYLQLKQQHNESTSQLVFQNQINNDKLSHDNSQSLFTGQMMQEQTPENNKWNFQKKHSQTSNSHVKEQKQSQLKEPISHQSTLDSKFFSPRILSTNAFPLESAKNQSSYSKLFTSQTQQKFFSNEDLKHSHLKKSLNNEDMNQEKIKNRKKKINQEQRDDQVDFSQNDWLAFKTKGLKTMGKKNQIDEKKRVHELQIEIASTTKTKSSSSASAKRHLSKVLSSDQRLPQMKIIQFIGLICFVTIASVTLQQYFSVMTSIKNSQLDMQVLDWPSEFRSKLYYMVKNYNLGLLMSTKYNDFKFDSASQKTTYSNVIKGNLRASQDFIGDHLDTLSRSNPDRLIFQQLRERTTQFIIPLYYDPKIINQTTSIAANQPGYIGANVNFSLLYAAMVFNQFCYWTSIGVGGRPEYFTIENQQNMVKDIIETEQSIIKVEQNEDHTINSQLNTLIAVIFTVSACCVGIILPLYTYIQTKKDRIVTLLSTFTNQKVHGLIANIYDNYYNDKQFSKFQKNTPNNIDFMRQPDSMKQNISQTTRLPRVSLLFCIIVFLIYIFIVSYPVIIKIITSNYLDQTSSNLNLAILMNSLKAYVGEITSIYYHGMVMKFYPDLKVLRIEEYQDYFDQLKNDMKQYETYVSQLTSDRYTLSRFEQSNYNRVFYPLIEGDICDVLSQNTNYIRNSTVFQTQNCQYIQNGFLKKGFQLSFKEFLSTFSDIYPIFSMDNTTAQYTQAKQSIFNTFSLKNFTDFQEYIEQTLDSMKYFIQDENQNYYDFLVEVQLGLIIYQVAAMLLIFVIGWYIFCLEMTKQINKTKRYLQIIDINTLIDNTYIVTFIKNNSNF